jgi:hypothetical protein
MTPAHIDNLLITWGDRLFYPGNRIVKAPPLPKLSALAAHAMRQRAATLRERIEATVVRHAPQVMVKVTGGGRGMQAIAAHWRYISKQGRLEIEDERGQTMRSKQALHGLADDWRYGGRLIEDTSPRREALNIMLSMPRGSDPATVLWAASQFAKAELADHKYPMVLHDHQANPHVHLSVRVESKHGQRLNPRKADLHRWRETFAKKLRERGVEAEATRQATRGATRNHPELWRVKAADDGRLRRPRSAHRSGSAVAASREQAHEAWQHIAAALADAGDRQLAASVHRFTGTRFAISTFTAVAPQSHAVLRPKRPSRVAASGDSAYSLVSSQYLGAGNAQHRQCLHGIAIK